MAEKSILILRVNEQLIMFSNNQFTGDWVGIQLDSGTGADPTEIHETPSINRDVKGLYYKGNSWTALADKLRRDWGNVGGSGNVKVTYSETLVPYSGSHFITIELQNTNWTFGTIRGTGYSSGKIEVVRKDNAAPVVPNSFSVELEGTANCATGALQYDVEIGGGTAPYSVSGTLFGTVQISSGTGTVWLSRLAPVTLRATDALGKLIGTKSVTPPTNLKSSYFTVNVYQRDEGAEAIIAPSVNLPSALLPVTYSLDNTTFQSSGGFSGLGFEENYTVYIKDAFGCTVTKIFATPPSVEGTTEPETNNRYALISNGGTLIFHESVNFDRETKPNYSNIYSCQELVDVNYSYVQEFDQEDPIVQQFKSGYDFNRVTLVTNRATYELDTVLQSQNLRLFEKVDAKLFRTIDGFMGIYFRNGYTYIENTTTPNGTSEYSAINIPSWGKVGQAVKVDNIGTATIKNVGRDDNRGLYLETNFPYTSLTDDNAKVQANYNEQPYNTYEFGFNMGSIDKTAQVIIEMGYNGEVDRTFKSELIKKIDDDYQMYLLEWSDSENKADIVHQTGIKHFARVRASFHNLTKSESETFRGDNATYSLDQTVYRTGQLKLAVLGHMMENKIHIAAGMENFSINKINYKKVKMDSEILGDSNIYEITGEFETGRDELTVGEGEIVLNEPLTDITAKPPTPTVAPRALGIGNGGLLLNGNGGFVLVDYS